MKKNRLNTKGGGLLDKQKKQRIVYAAILSLFFLVIVLLTIIFWNKLTGIVKDPQSFRERIEKKGWGGKALFVALMAAQVVLAPVPGHPFEVAGGYCFGFLWGTVLTSLGAALGSLIAFLLSRLLGARVIHIFYSEEKLKKAAFLQSGEKQSFLTFVAFLVPGLPKDMLAYFMGLTSMRLPTFLLISTVGRLPGIMMAVLGGMAVQTQDKRIYLAFALVTIAMIAISALYYLIKRRKKAPEKMENKKL